MATHATTAGTRRRPARRGAGATLREDIVAAASEMLAESGDANALTLRALARRVGVAATSIYLHFETVQDVVDEVKRVRFEELSAALAAAADAAGDDPVARVTARGHTYVRYGAEHPGEYAVMFAVRFQQPDSPFPRQPLTQDALYDLAGDVAEALRRRGDAPSEAEALMVSFHLWTSLHGMVSLRALRPVLPWPDLDAEVADLAERMLGRRPPGR